MMLKEMCVILSQYQVAQSATSGETIVSLLMQP